MDCKETENKKPKKPLITFIVSLILTILSILLFFNVILAKQQGREPTLFGFYVSIVVTQSMEPQIMVGDMIVSRPANISEVKVHDYVIFRSPDPMLQGMTIVHEVVRIEEIGGSKALITKGTNALTNPNEDDYPVYEIIGKFMFKSALLGKLYKFILTPWGIITVFILVFGIYYGIKYTVKFIKKRKSLASNTKNGQ